MPLFVPEAKYSVAWEEWRDTEFWTNIDVTKNGGFCERCAMDALDIRRGLF